MKTKMQCTDPACEHLLAPYEFGLLEEEERARFEQHLSECALCADRIFELSHVTTAARTDARKIAETIESRSARQTASDSGGHASRTPRTVRRPRKWALPALGLAAAATLVFLILGRGPDYAGLARIEPAAYVPIDTRSGSGAASDFFERGMELYGAEQYREAIPFLQDAVRTAGDTPAWQVADQARFYLAVAQLLTGAPERAEDDLRALAASSGGPLADRSRWYLAQSALRQNDPERAEEQLRILARASPVHADEAAELLSRINALRNR